MMKVRKIVLSTLILAGILAPLFYIAAAIIGGLMFPEYSHVRDSVSDLLAIGSPNKTLLDILMFFSNLFTIIGSFAVLIVHRKSFNKIVNVGVVLILITGLSSILSSYVFRLPHAGNAMTLSGAVHISLVAIVVIISLAVILLIGFGISKYRGWEYFKGYSILTFILFLISGLLSPIIIVNKFPIVGLVERIAVGIYFQWQIVLFVKFYKYKQ